MQIKGSMRHSQEGRCKKDNRKKDSKEEVEILCKKSPSQSTKRI
jgi:hypothetical protein